jgi:uncharacterized protein
MFVVHFHDRSTDPGGFDEVIRTLVWRLVETKSHGTFALLFGAGFAIQLRRSEERRERFAGRYLRRLAVLAFFGFIAHACFGYNVLLGYALWGVPLLIMRTWSTRTLLVIAALSAASLPLYHLLAAWVVQLSAGPDGVATLQQTQQALAAQVNDAINAAEAQTSYAALFAARLRHMAWFYSQPFFFLPNATLTLFIVGFLLVRHRVFEHVRAHRRVLSAMIVFGVVAWLADNWLFELWDVPFIGVLRDQWLTFAYVAAALLAMAHWPAVVERLRTVANAGRMALTNYLLQIATLDLLFSGYAIGLGQIRPVYGLVAALGCFGAEATLSTIWLKHFRFGPAEWLWRSLTYGRWQPMRRGAPVPVVETISA